MPHDLEVMLAVPEVGLDGGITSKFCKLLFFHESSRKREH